MKRLILVLAGFATLSGCSEVRERRAPANDKVAQQPDLTLPDPGSRTDTSVTLASRTEQPVSPVEQQAPRAEPEPPKVVQPKPAKPKPTTPKKPRVKRTSPAPKAESPPVDSSVQAYAPNAPDTSPTMDSSRVADSASATATADSARAGQVRIATADTNPSPRVDTAASVAADTLALRTDTARAGDSVVARLPDTTATDTTSTTATDTMVAPAPAAAADTGPNTSVEATATANTSSAANAAARTLAVGTEIHAALDDSITSRRDTVGQQISAHVMENVKGPDGRTLIAAGTPVRFTVTRIRPSRSKNSQGRLTLRADGIALHGQLRPVQANIRPVPRELRWRGVTGSEAAKVGGGAAAGAVIGGVVGKTKGAVIGGVAGAAAGAVIASQTATRDVVVKAKTPVVLVLTAPLVAP